MPYQNIDATVSPADLQAVKDAFAVVLNKLPFLINLTTAERKSITKLGPDSLSFVQNALTAAQTNTTIFPASFNVSGFQKDFDLFAVLTELSTLAESVFSQIDDTRMAVGGEAMQEAGQAYGYIKAASKTEPGRSRWPSSWARASRRPAQKPQAKAATALSLEQRSKTWYLLAALPSTAVRWQGRSGVPAQNGTSAWPAVLNVEIIELVRWVSQFRAGITQFRARIARYPTATTRFRAGMTQFRVGITEC